MEWDDPFMEGTLVWMDFWQVMAIGLLENRDFCGMQFKRGTIVIFQESGHVKTGVIAKDMVVGGLHIQAGSRIEVSRDLSILCVGPSKPSDFFLQKNGGRK